MLFARIFFFFNVFFLRTQSSASLSNIWIDLSSNLTKSDSLVKCTVHVGEKGDLPQKKLGFIDAIHLINSSLKVNTSHLLQGEWALPPICTQ